MDTPNIHEVINDINISIADMETLMFAAPQVYKIHYSRAIGQLKAARGCLLVITREEVKSA